MKSFLFGLALFVLTAYSTTAGQKDLTTLPGLLVDGAPVQLHFETEWSGVTVASVTVTASEKKGIVSTRLRMKTQGAANALSPVKMESRTRTLIAAPLDLAPLQFDYAYETRKRSRGVSVKYNPRSRTAEPTIETRPGEPERDRQREDAVGEKLRRGTLDPMSALITILRHAQLRENGKAEKDFVIAVYDGVHRYDVAISHRGRSPQTVNGRRLPTFKYVAKVRPIAGFKPKRIEEWEKRHIELYVSADGRYLPVKIAVRGSSGMARLTKVCNNSGKCQPT